MKLSPILSAPFAAAVAAFTQCFGRWGAGRPEFAVRSDRNCHRDIKTTLVAISTAAFVGIQLCGSAAAQNIVYNQPLPASLINVNSNFTSSGDGYVAIPYKDRFYIINHHQQISTSNIFGCIQKDPSVVFCAGFGTLHAGTTNFYERRLSDGDTSSTLDSSTSGAPEEYFIDASGKMYYAVTRFAANTGSQPQDWGLGCFDLENNVECGYRSLSSNPNNRSFRVAIEGPFEIGGKLYLLDLEMRLYCVDPVTMLTCQTSLDLSSAANGGMPQFVSSTSGYSGHIGGEVVGNNLYLTVVYEAVNATFNPPSPTTTDGKRVICVDVSGLTMKECTGWSGAVKFVSMEGIAGYNYSNYLWFDLSGAPTSICNRGQTAQSCVNLNSGTATSHPDVASGSLSFGLGREVHVGTQSYFPSWLDDKGIFCYDFAIPGVCSGWPSNGVATPATVSPAANYALSVDESGCMWALGHNNKLWSLDPITRVAPCNRGKFTATAAHTCEVRTWQELKIANITASDYDTLEVRIKDKTGVWQTFTYSGGSSFSIPLTGAAFNPLSPLDFEVVAYFASGVTAYHTQPVITIAETDEACHETETGLLKVCKVAGQGVNTGDKFEFTAVSAATGASTSVTVSAGPAPGGYCTVVDGYTVGDTVTLTEQTAGYTVTSIVVAPANPAAQVNLGDGSVKVPIGTGVIEVTYTDERAKPGYLEICKYAYGGVQGDVTFSVPSLTPGQPTQVTLPAVSGSWSCSPAIQVPSGQVVIHETPIPGAEMIWCFTYPDSRQVADCDSSASTSTVIVVPGNVSTQTIAAIVNGPPSDHSSHHGRRGPPPGVLPPWSKRAH